MGLEGRVGCKFEKVLGVKLEEREKADVGFVGCAISGDWIWDFGFGRRGTKKRAC